MYPTAADSGLYFGHPEAKYFSIGKVEQDQVVDYAGRMEMSLPDIEQLAVAISKLRSGITGESLLRYEAEKAFWVWRLTAKSSICPGE